MVKGGILVSSFNIFTWYLQHKVPISMIWQLLVM